jgi:UDP-N-acetylmuramoyl-L-alanyl-D-glutamate--2,6-diaminopimelate ligase
MEASSHSLEQERVAGIEFFAGAFTNLTQDHLDYHADMDDYRNAKLRLFERISGEGRFTVVNIEDPAAKAFVAASKVPCHTYGKGGDIAAQDVGFTVNRTRFTVTTPWGSAPVEMRLLGAHNVSNALCAIALCGGLGIKLDEIVKAVGTLPCVPGRFEHVDAGQSFQVIVDYAHTDDGLRNVLTAAREICKGRIVTVFGCGGDRDKTKRPKMATVVANMSDYAIITSDNPRTEDPHRILMDVEVGMQRLGRKRNDEYLVIEDRAQAIREALRMAKSGDLVMIAGKGHEDYQIIGTEKIHFDDRETARMILEELRKS